MTTRVIVTEEPDVLFDPEAGESGTVSYEVRGLEDGEWSLLAHLAAPIDEPAMRRYALTEALRTRGPG